MQGYAMIHMQLINAPSFNYHPPPYPLPTGGFLAISVQLGALEERGSVRGCSHEWTLYLAQSAEVSLLRRV
jgi:hypothetical protein